MCTHLVRTEDVRVHHVGGNPAHADLLVADGLLEVVDARANVALPARAAALELPVRARARNVCYALDVPIDGRAVQKHDDGGDRGCVDWIARESHVVVDDELVARRRGVIAVVDAKKKPMGI
jgi:hypothetical protein